MTSVRYILRAGSAIFGGSAIPLLVTPEYFAELLGLEPTDALAWSLRMTGITVVALAGNMFLNSLHSSTMLVRRAGMVMLISAAGMGVITLLIPGELTWFGWLYVALGFGFSAAYALALTIVRGRTSSF